MQALKTLKGAKLEEFIARYPYDRFITEETMGVFPHLMRTLQPTCTLTGAPFKTVLTPTATIVEISETVSSHVTRCLCNSLPDPDRQKIASLRPRKGEDRKAPVARR